MILMTQGQIRTETGATPGDISQALRRIRPVKKESRWEFYDAEEAIRAVEQLYHGRLANATGRVEQLRAQIARCKDARRRMKKEGGAL